MDILGLGSVNNEDIESITLNKDSAGDQLVFKISIQMLPVSEICLLVHSRGRRRNIMSGRTFIWYILEGMVQKQVTERGH